VSSLGLGQLFAVSCVIYGLYRETLPEDETSNEPYE